MFSFCLWWLHRTRRRSLSHPLIPSALRPDQIRCSRLLSSLVLVALGRQQTRGDWKQIAQYRKQIRLLDPIATSVGCRLWWRWTSWVAMCCWWAVLTVSLSRRLRSFVKAPSSTSPNCPSFLILSLYRNAPVNALLVHTRYMCAFVAFSVETSSNIESAPQQVSLPLGYNKWLWCRSVPFVPRIPSSPDPSKAAKIYSVCLWGSDF